MNEEFFPPDMYCWILNRLPARCTHCPEIAKKLVQLKLLKNQNLIIKMLIAGMAFHSQIITLNIYSVLLCV